MSNGKLLILMSAMLIASCAKPGAIPAMRVDNSCDWVKPLYLTASDIQTLALVTRRDILIHNRNWQRHCQ